MPVRFGEAWLRLWLDVSCGPDLVYWVDVRLELYVARLDVRRQRVSADGLLQAGAGMVVCDLLRGSVPM